MRRMEHVARTGAKRNVYKILFGKLDGKTLERPRHIWTNNIKIDA
jgi:hypothetical protein